jgi:hypothetical protein
MYSRSDKRKGLVGKKAPSLKEASQQQQLASGLK